MEDMDRDQSRDPGSGKRNERDKRWGLKRAREKDDPDACGLALAWPPFRRLHEESCSWKPRAFKHSRR